HAGKTSIFHEEDPIGTQRLTARLMCCRFRSGPQASSQQDQKGYCNTLTLHDSSLRHSRSLFTPLNFAHQNGNIAELPVLPNAKEEDFLPVVVPLTHVRFIFDEASFVHGRVRQ